MWTAFWRALVDGLLGFIEAGQQRRERDKLIEENTQDDARIADQAAAIRVLRDADSVPAKPPPGAPRRGRRE